MIAARQGPSFGAERFPLVATRERWLDFLALEHAALALPVDFERDGDAFVVRRAPVIGRRIADGRIPGESALSLFLQAAGLSSFLQAHGFWLAEEDLLEAVHDRSGETARLWLTRTPASVGVAGSGPSASAVLAAFLHRLFARGRRIANPAARSLFDRMLAADAPFRRSDFWLASTFRAFPELALPAAAQARERTIGTAGCFLRQPGTRALLAKGEAILQGRMARVFAAAASALTPGGALGLEAAPQGVAAAARELRALHEQSGARRPVWIAVDLDRWDTLSRRAFETACRSLGDAIEVRRLETTCVPPRLPDEWRREIFVPCGTLSASLRFYERFAELAQANPSSAYAVARALTSSPQWAGFVSDPTGDGLLPPIRPMATGDSDGSAALPMESEVLEALALLPGPVSEEALHRLFSRRFLGKALQRLAQRQQAARDVDGRWRRIPGAGQGSVLTAARRRALCLRWAALETDPGRRIELLLEGGDPDEALVAAQRWLAQVGTVAPERWFGLSARLAAACGPERPVWLERLEAEREFSGGRLEEGIARLRSICESACATIAEKREARLRAAENLAKTARNRAAAREAASWRAEYPDAPALERVRALRIEASGRARDGEHDAALSLLDEAEREGAGEGVAERLETALVRAGVYSLAARFREEQEVYERWKDPVAALGDDRLTVRLLAHEALCLSDRRDFPAAIARLQQALAVTRDDPVQRTYLTIDLATALYHSGRSSSCGPLLEEAASLAASVGRLDLARVVRINRIELAIHRAEWEEATREIDALLAQAEADQEDLYRLVALHQRSRVALRRGYLDAAERDNTIARALAARLHDRLEIGELWLEDGDRALYAGDFEGARRAWEMAAADVPDRSDSDLRARSRLRELGWKNQGGPPQDDREILARELTSGEYEAAERAARWRLLFGTGACPPELWLRAQEILRARGGAALADHVFGGEHSPPVATGTLRPLRDAVAAALAGGEPDVPLAPLGLSGLVIRDSEGRELVHWTSSLAAGAPGEASVRALAAGAARYELTLWPPPADAVVDAIAFALETLLYRSGPTAVPEEFARGWKRFQVITADASMEEPYRRLVRFAPQPVTVLIQGESGSGKEAVARAVHQLSPRSSGPFVAVNVAAIPAALLESELFGHLRGAFTGADRDRRGLLEEASQGTVFFDEIGDLPLALQAKLLRALQEREIRRVGENRARSIDVRVVSATSRPLAAEVERGAFREDLYYRLHVAVITLPSLRERGRDVVLLARHFLERYAREYGRGSLQFSPEALASLSAHSWPGNVRELQNAVAQATALAEPGGTVNPDLLPPTLHRDRRPMTPPQGYRSRVDAHRRDLISEALDRAGGNRTRAARDLGLSRQALLYLIRELQVTSRPRTGH